MFGLFKPTAPLSGGLLWKIPYRLSRPQKLRHRRRLRKVDNVVATLDTALKRQTAATFSTYQQLFQSSPSSQSTLAPNQDGPPSTSIPEQALPEELAATIEGQQMLDKGLRAQQEARRHGKGPKQGDFVPTFSEHNVKMPSGRLLTDVALAQGTTKLLERWKAEMPTEQEMLPRDKYTVFNRYAKKYRKGVHKIPKWTRVSQRLNPPGF